MLCWCRGGGRRDGDESKTRGLERDGEPNEEERKECVQQDEGDSGRLARIIFCTLPASPNRHPREVTEEPEEKRNDDRKGKVDAVGLPGRIKNLLN
jgi:hypothetical protein